uniref:ZAD domain-containing protein n=1 Tax=Anopheles minimus TaxID=112268 RepID=A0A182W3J8_9DIPT
MENIGQSHFLPVDNMAASAHKTLDQTCRKYSIPGHNTSNGCCRLCFKGNCHLQELFPGGYTEDLLISKIFECTTVEITFASDPDALICYSCVAKIEEFHRYREQCRSNDMQHKNSKRRLGGRMLTAPASGLIPAKYVKKEIDSEGFEISASDFYPLDVAEQSYGTLETSMDGSAARFADSSGALDSAISNEVGVRNSEEDENLLELMPEQTHDEFSVSYTTDMNEEYENNNEVFCELPIKEEPQDINDDTNDWNDFGMEDDDGTMQHSTNLIPLIDNCSYSTNSDHDSAEQQTFRKVYNGTELACLVQEGFLYVHVKHLQWRCRIESCGAAVFQNEYSKELETNGVNHAHDREVPNGATDTEILHLVENGSLPPPPPTPPEESDDESFHYIKNIRKGCSLVYKGYKYSMKHTNVDGTTYWKCRSHKGSCSAGLYQTPDNKFTTARTHTHAKLDRAMLTNKNTGPYVSSVSTKSDEPLGDKSSPGKIKLRIARQTATTNTPFLKPLPGDVENNPSTKKIPINQKDAQGVIRRSYDYNIVKNGNGRPRLYLDDNLYVRESTKQEATGAVVTWRCRRNYDMCGVAALQYEDGLVEVVGDHDHAPVKKMMNIPENSMGTTDYHLLPTFKGGEALVLDGYRYIKAYQKPDGMSLWRCTALPGVACRVKIILATDGVAYLLKNVRHDHDRPKQSRTMCSNTTEVATPTKQRIVTKDSPTNASTPSSVRSKVDNKPMRKPIESSATVATSPARRQRAKAPSKSLVMRNYRVIRNKKGNRALVHAGYRYCKVRIRQDGIVSWFCRINKKTCNVGLYQYPDGSLEYIKDSRHNHSPTDPIELPKKVAPAVKKGKPYHMDDETFVSNEWYIVRNRKNGITLIHAGYRYTRKGNRVDDTSLWRCTRTSQGCRAGIVMYDDETIGKLNDTDHSHPPPTSTMEGETIISGDLDKSTEQLRNATMDESGNEPELSLVNFNGCIEEQDDPEANMRSLLSTMLDVSDAPNDKSTAKILLSPSKAHYRYVKNRRLTRSLVFRGYRYARSTMRESADGSVKWICQMNKKTCRVSVKVLKDGSLEIDDHKHNHPQLPEDIDEHCDNEDEDEHDDANVSIGSTTFDNDSTIQQAYEMNEDTAAHEPYFALNRCKGKSLIFQRNRYSRENTRPDGSSIWRCMVRSDCISKAIIQADGTCAVFRNANHHHPPLDELPEPLQKPDKLALVPFKSSPVEKLPVTKLTVKGDMLIYKQNRMKKIKSFADGTAMFKCAEVDRCPAKVKLQLGETDDDEALPKVVSESAHSHQNVLTDIPLATSSGSKMKSPLKLKRYSPSDSVEHGKEYQLFKNDRGQVSLVYKGYRFSLRNHNVNGNTSWKCRANKTCSAYVTFTEDGHVVRTQGQVEVLPHDHASNGEYIDRAVPFELDQLHPPPRNLSQFVSNWVDGLYKSELCGKTKSSLKLSPSHGDGKKTIHHKNFSYRLQTIKNGREFWRCTMFKARACRAALFCSSNGTIIQHENGREHNHEPTKPSSTASNFVRKACSSLKGKAYEAKQSNAFDGANDAFGTINEIQKTVKRSHSSLHYDDRSVEESSAPPAYQIVEKDGDDILHYEKHRYVVIFAKRESNTDAPKRWRCCLWNSRHQCPVELTILDTGEIHFETDPTHNHRPPPPELQDAERVPALNMKGTKKYELLGRNLKTVFYKGYKFYWKELRNNWTYYTCVCSLSHECNVSVKVDSDGLLYECSNETHNHSPTHANVQSDDSTTLQQPKSLSVRALASKQARLANCSQPGSDDYRFVRSSVGNSMIFEGYRYWFHNKLTCGFHVYRCRYQKIKSCPGAVYMDMETQLVYHRYDAEHNHEVIAEDTIANIESPVLSTSTSESGNRTLSISQQPNVPTQDTDVDDECDLSASAIESSEPQTEVPKKEEESEDAIITSNYTFVKNYLNKNQLLYEDYVYECVPLSYRNDSDKFYSCLFSECSVSVKLLPSGNLKVLKQNQHDHQRPDLTDYRDVGRGSTDFTTLSSRGSGTKIKILFEGYMYYPNVSQPFQDDTKEYLCCSNMSTKEKGKSGERCSASLELLPNDRVIVTGIHHHPVPKLTDSDTNEKSQSKLMVLEGRSYRYLHKHPDGTVVWQCTDDPKCKAKVYVKPHGKLLYGPTKHVLRHVMPKLAHHASNDLKISVPASGKIVTIPAPAAAAGSLVSSTSSNAIVPSSTGNLRTKWYQGNRYNFYLTRRDGVEYWRCSKRMEENCETAILCYPSGTILPHNSLPHTHPPLKVVSEKSQDKVPPASYTPKLVEKLEPNAEVAGNVSNYPIPNTSDKPEVQFVTYKGLQYALRKWNSDGIRMYRCCNKPCTHMIFINKRGKIFSKRTTWHSCEKRLEAVAEASMPTVVTTTTNAYSSSASGLGFDKPEIEDPDDLVDENNCSPMEPLLKRMRLDIEMVEENGQRRTTPETIVQTEDSLSAILNTDETDVEMEEEVIEESYVEMQHSPNGGNDAPDNWEQEYLEQEYECPDAIDNETVDSVTEDQRPTENDDDDVCPQMQKSTMGGGSSHLAMLLLN